MTDGQQQQQQTMADIHFLMLEITGMGTRIADANGIDASTRRAWELSSALALGLQLGARDPFLARQARALITDGDNSFLDHLTDKLAKIVSASVDDGMTG